MLKFCSYYFLSVVLTGRYPCLLCSREACTAVLKMKLQIQGEFLRELLVVNSWLTLCTRWGSFLSLGCSVVPVRERSTSVAAAKPASVASSKGEYVVTKLDDLINWARRVSISLNIGNGNTHNVGIILW